MHASRRRYLTCLAGSLALARAMLAIGGAGAAETPRVQFNRDIRPILADKCFQCHGPDGAQRKAELRLDVESSAKADGAIVPGQATDSELHRRITAADPEERMPPAATGKKLSPVEIELLTRWIDEGARWEKHWSLIAPLRPVPPPVRVAGWVRNPIDAFVLARLEAVGMAPSTEADRATLVRRVTLDLTGLPPTPEEVDAFAADERPDAYERVVDRLLRSPRYGERMASRWLDAARYADTSGYQTDGVRYMWRWRDWVIEAYNRNLPFDQFTIEQLAGDMLPGATLDQRIATGFNRNHRGNAEGGIIPEEYAVEYVVDRVDTTATVWLGLTLACARCHDHKFDPFTQREFYQFFAFFNNVPEKGRAVKVGNSPPYIPTPTRDQQRQLEALDEQLAAAGRALADMEGAIGTGQAQWSSAFAPSEPVDWAPHDALVAHFPLDENAQETSAANQTGSTQNPGTQTGNQAADAQTAKQAETASPGVEGPISFAPGMIGKAASFGGDAAVNAGDVANFGYFDRFTLSAWIRPSGADGTLLARMLEEADVHGYTVQLVAGRLQLNLIERWLDDALRVETEEPLALDRWQHVAVSYDGSREASGVRIAVDGEPRKLRVLLDELNQSFNSTAPLRIGGGGPGPRFQGLIDDVRVYRSDLTDSEVQLLATADPIDRIVAIDPAQRTPRQSAKLRAYYLDQQAPEEVRAVLARVAALGKQRFELQKSFPTTMVMQEMSPARPSFVLVRGQYDKPGEAVMPDVPASLLPLAPPAPRTRLGLARWLVDPTNPLVARVAVNRFWQSYFGTGLVKTIDDFGAQGDPPSHPELLDWLAREFVDGGWNVKAMQKLIVTSATYRQSSKVLPALLDRDPDNRNLARGPRFRLSAEVIRDQALAASGLLVERLGGPSVNPYQPPGLWKELTGGGDVVQDHGPGLYRRSLYTFWKRTIAPPSMMTFDAAGREACTVRETRTNTPLQALTLLNEVTFVEAARLLAQRAMLERAGSPDERIARAFRLALARNPTPRELEVLVQSFERARATFGERPAKASELLRVGEAPADARLEAGELAAYATVASLILNLDEVVTKE
jgi:hypothetical protein